MANKEPKLDTNEARQGRKGTPVLRILVIGLVLALIAFVIVGLYGAFLPQDDLAVTPGEGGSAPVEDGTSETTPAPPANN